MSKKYADVIIDISHEKVDRPFQYRIPDELLDKIAPGIRVHVPFGKGNKDMTGYVVDLSDKTCTITPEQLAAAKEAFPGATVMLTQLFEST